MKEKCRHKSMSRHIKKRKRQYNLYITEGQRGKWDPQGYVIRRTFFFFLLLLLLHDLSVAVAGLLTAFEWFSYLYGSIDDLSPELIAWCLPKLQL